MLKSQTSDFFNKVNEYNQDVGVQLSLLQEQLPSLTNNASNINAAQQQGIKQQLQNILDGEHEEMAELAQKEERQLDLITSERKIELNVTTIKGIMQIRKQLDDFAIEQNNFQDAIQDQQELLKNTSHSASDIMLEAQRTSQTNKYDVLRLKSLAEEMQDRERLLVDRGQSLIALNDELKENREMMAERIEMVKINTESSMRAMQDRYDSLKDQASKFYDKVREYNQEVRDRIDLMRVKLHDMSEDAQDQRASQEQNIKDRIQNMLDHEHEDMIKIADSQQRSEEILQDQRDQQEDAKELLNDKLQHSQDMIEDEQEKVKDQQEMMEQRIADEEQRIQDQQARQNP